MYTATCGKTQKSINDGCINIQNIFWINFNDATIIEIRRFKIQNSLFLFIRIKKKSYFQTIFISRISNERKIINNN